jgi:glycine dehydrogenase
MPNAASVAGGLRRDVCHLNLHKTFCIPHGGGGPGVGPIGVAKHLAPYLPREFILDPTTGKIVFGEGDRGQRPHHGNGSTIVTAAAKEAISQLPRSVAPVFDDHVDVHPHDGCEGLKRASEVAILSKLHRQTVDRYFPVLFKGKRGLSHECIIDLRQWKNAGIKSKMSQSV